MLNAFRHQRREHRAVPASGRDAAGAQRLSASTEGTPALCDVAVSVIWCAQRLSASTEGTLTSSCMPAVYALQCSTPFGINGRNTPRDRPKPCARTCAQRLSASTEGTRRSTRQSGGCNGEVLNAFRHQRKEHCRPVHTDRSTTGAQRLSASTEGTRRIVASWQRFRWSAQRLSASTEGTRRTYLDHWWLKSRGAQRLSASTEGTLPASPYCSISRSVLNAFRHQRKEHDGRPRLSVIRGRCAQRLSASTEGTLTAMTS